MIIKAIETEVNGYIFRSRTEARWSIFCDKLNLKYCYEMEGVEVDGIKYLPDFWLPQCKIWFEAKGQEPTEEEKEKACLLSISSQAPVVIAHGDIEVGAVRQEMFAAYVDHKGEVVTTNKAIWTVCNECDCPDVFIDESEPHHLCLHSGHWPKHPKLVEASRLARSARFEKFKTTTYKRRWQ